MLKKFVTYIEQEPWDEEMLNQERIAKGVCWTIIILAVIYFAPAFLKIFVK
jgi:hypothetical protein